jgi:hypothetical protein
MRDSALKPGNGAVSTCSQARQRTNGASGSIGIDVCVDREGRDVIQGDAVRKPALEVVLGRQAVEGVHAVVPRAVRGCEGDDGRVGPAVGEVGEEAVQRSACAALILAHTMIQERVAAGEGSYTGNARTR